MHSVSQTLAGCRILSVALNLPGPAALMRLATMGAACTKLEQPSANGNITTSDPMGQYAPHAYRELHAGIDILHADLKTAEGQQQAQAVLAQTDVLLTSMRPAALVRLGWDWASLHAQFPQLNMVQIVGATGARSNEAGHDLTYQAEAGLVTSLQMPASLMADMAGALMASEAVLQALLLRQRSGQGQLLEVGLLEAAQWLGIPRRWGMTTPDGVTGGAHAGYRIYACQDGRVAIAALEPHFAQRLWEQVSPDSAVPAMDHPSTQQAIEAFCASHSCTQLNALAAQYDLPLVTMAD